MEYFTSSTFVLSTNKAPLDNTLKQLKSYKKEKNSN